MQMFQRLALSTSGWLCVSLLVASAMARTEYFLNFRKQTHR